MQDACCRWRCAGVAAAALVLLPGGGVRSQDGLGEPAGLRFELGLSSELRLAHNPELEPDTSEGVAVSETGLRFAVASDTRTESFRFEVDTRFDLSTDTDLVESGFASPSLSLDYAREASRSRLSLRFDRLVSDVDRTTPIFIDLDADGTPELVFLDEASGEVAFTVASLNLLTGIDRPISHELDFAIRDRDFIDVPPEAGLFGSRTATATTTTRLRISPITTGSLAVTFSRYSADDDVSTSRETRSVRFGLSTALDEATEVQGSIGYSEIDISTDAMDELQSGIIASFEATRELPRGLVGIDFALSLDEDGSRQTLSVNRSFTFPASVLRASLGVTRQDESTELIAEASYVKELKSGQLSLRLARGITESATTDEDELLTSLALGYRRQVTEASSISLNFDVLQRDEDDGGLTQAGLSAAYTTALTREWDLSVGYHARYREDESGDATSSIVFARVGRDFPWRP